MKLSLNLSLFAAACVLIVSSPVRADSELTQKYISEGHALCYEYKDLKQLSKFAVDQNLTGMGKLMADGKCFINHSRKMYMVFKFDPSKDMQAVVLPSGTWARTFTYSIEN